MPEKKFEEYKCHRMSFQITKLSDKNSYISKIYTIQIHFQAQYFSTSDLFYAVHYRRQNGRVQYDAVQYCTVLYDMVWYGMVGYVMVQYGMLQ